MTSHFIEKDVKESFQAISDSLKEGIIPSYIHNDPAIYELEVEKIFKKTWVFVAHESEIKNNGDYVVRYVTNDRIIVNKDENGKIGAFFNFCTHRGVQLCQSECGNAKQFTCPYHGWSFKNNGELVGVPFEDHMFGKLDRSQWSLRPVPHVDTFNGLIFVNLNENAQSLSDYLGDFKFYLQLYSQRTKEGFEVVGPPQRYVIDMDWKVTSQNQSGDTYHAGPTHQSVMEIGVHPNNVKDFRVGGKRDGTDINAGVGVMGITNSSPQDRGYPDWMVEHFEEYLSPEHKEVFLNKETTRWPTRTHVFPNLSFLNAAAYVKDDLMMPFLAMRVWRPLGPGKIEAWQWVLVEKEAPEWFKEMSMKAFIMTFGVSGMEEQDDTIQWRSLTENSAATTLKEFDQSIHGGVHDSESKIVKDWPGPGLAYTTNKSDVGTRYFMKKWMEYMEM